MKKFIVIYYSPAGAMEKMGEATPEEQAEGMKPWMEWAERIGDGLVDLGTPLTTGLAVTPEGTSPSTKNVTGFSILQAESIEDAAKLLDNHPHLGWMEGCEMEIHESMPLEM